MFSALSKLFSPKKDANKHQKYEVKNDDHTPQHKYLITENNDTTNKNDKAEISSSNSTKKKPNPKTTKGKSSKQKEALCRICEQLINIEEFKEHSTTCQDRYKLDMKAISSDERLQRLTRGIKKKIKSLNEKKDPKKQSIYYLIIFF